MKLKNSYILLIAISLFLLVSIGSVCASDAAMETGTLTEESGADISPVGNSSLIETSVDAEDTIISEKDPQIIDVTVKDNESQSIEVVKENLTVTENKTNIEFTYNNSAITITSKLPVGNHSLIISYLGNGIYNQSSTNIILSIFGNYTMQSPDSVNVNSSKVIEIPLNITNGVEIRSLSPGDFTAIIGYKEGNETKNETLNVLDYKNGKLVLNYPLEDVITSSVIGLRYNALEEKLSKNITVNRIYNVKINPLKNETEYKGGNFTFQLIDMDGGNLSGKTISMSYAIKAGTITFQESISSKTDDDGIVNFNNANMVTNVPMVMGFNITALTVGTHSVSLSSSGLVFNNSNQIISIIKATINIKIDNFVEEYETNENVTITVTNAETGDPVKYEYLHLSMPQTTGKDYYFMTDADGQSKISVTQLIPGTYDLTVNNNDTVNINKKEVKGNITITPISVVMKVTLPSRYYYNTGNIAAITVLNKATGKVVPNAIILIQIYTGTDKTPKAYLYQANNKGIAYVNYAPSSVGSHKMVVSSADTRYDATAVTKTIKVQKASAKIAAPKVNAYYKDGKYFTMKLVNTKNSKPIYAAKLTIKVFISKTSYYNYNGQTGLDGKVKISLDSYKPGTYKVVVECGDSKNYTAKSVTSQFVIKSAPAKLIPVKLVSKKGVKNYFKVGVKNTKTKQAIAGIKVTLKVYTGKTAKTYTVKTNSKGIAQLNVKSLKVGTHKVVVASANKYVVAKAATSSIKITK